MKIAVLSDIHDNIWNLERALRSVVETHKRNGSFSWVTSVLPSHWLRLEMPFTVLSTRSSATTTAIPTC